MKAIEWRKRFLIGLSIITAGVAGAAPDIGFYCDFTTKDLNTGSPATGTLTNVTTVSGGTLVVPTNTPAGVTYGMARQYLNTSGAGWGTNTVAGIFKWNGAGPTTRNTLYSSSGGADNGWGVILYAANSSKPTLQICSNYVALIDLTLNMTVLTNVDYFVAASWNDQGSGSPLQATLYLLNRQTWQAGFTNRTSSYNSPVPPNTTGGSTDPLGQIRIAGRQNTGLDAINGSVDAVWGIKQFTATQASYEKLVSDLGADQVPVVRVALSGDNSDGTTWAKAYTNLQTAVDSPNAVYGVWVKQGVYALTNPIVIRDYVSIFGGFAGTETALTQRNWRVNATVISNAVTATAADPNHRVFYCEGKANWRLDGLTIRNGQYWATSAWPDYYNNMGAGIRALNVTGNCAIDNCTIRDCKPANNALYAGGIALSVTSPNTMQFNNTLFYNNQGTAGGGAYIDGSGTTTLKNCMFVSNYGISSTSGNGPGLNIVGTAAKVINCVFYGNYWAGSDRGSAIRVDGANALIANCVFMTNLNSVAIAAQNTSITNFTVSNCCFYANDWGIAYDKNTTTTNTDIAAFNAVARKGANISGNPLFVNAPALDFTFPGSSPCVDAGTDAGGYAPTNDFYGNPRPVVRVNASTPYDIGIYEIGPQRGSVVMIQ